MMLLYQAGKLDPPYSPWYTVQINGESALIQHKTMVFFSVYEHLLGNL